MKADLLAQLGRYSEARGLCERAIDIQERALGPDHIGILQSLHGLGALNVAAHNDEEARQALEQAREVIVKSRERYRGTWGGPERIYDNFYFASVLNLLGVIESRAAEADQARVLYERSLEIFQDMYGPNHPYLGWPLNNLGELHRDAGDYAIARTYLERALEIRERAYGNDHAFVAETLHSLAVLHDRLNDDDVSRELFERSLAMTESCLDPNHPFVAGILEDYAILLSEMGETSKAGRLVARARAIELEAKKTPQ
jgi:tetratricopeptide (TPR) repeat protein